MRMRWIIACGLGEALGIAVVASTYAATDRALLAPPAPWILVAGAWEGLCLGTAQALVLRRAGISAGLWILLTTVGAAAGYAVALVGGAGGSGAQTDPAPWLLLAGGGGLGMVMGTLLGAVQSFAVRAHVSPPLWIAANAVGWAPAMAIIMVAASAAGADWSFAGVLALGAAAGALAGLAVGVFTTIPLRQIARAPSAAA